MTASDLPNAANILRTELNLSEEVFDVATAKKYESLLEKKWTSIVRLQRKIRSPIEILSHTGCASIFILLTGNM